MILRIPHHIIAFRAHNIVYVVYVHYHINMYRPKSDGKNIYFKHCIYNGIKWDCDDDKQKNVPPVCIFVHIYCTYINILTERRYIVHIVTLVASFKRKFVSVCNVHNGILVG